MTELNGVILGMNSFSIPCSIQRFNVIITFIGRGIITSWVHAYMCVGWGGVGGVGNKLVGLGQTRKYFQIGSFALKLGMVEAPTSELCMCVLHIVGLSTIMQYECF